MFFITGDARTRRDQTEKTKINETLIRRLSFRRAFNSIAVGVKAEISIIVFHAWQIYKMLGKEPN